MVAIPLKRLEGKYEILEKLQEGGMGAIYKVRHRLLDEVRVIKVIRPHLEQDSSLKARFLKEARAAAKLSHPNIAHLYDYTVDEDGAAFIVMEFIPGLTLGELSDAGEILPLGLALEVARQCLTAIGHIHRHGIAHRDISPDNLMLTTDVDGRPLVKLLDLGLAKTIGGASQLTAAGVFVGKFRYAAPEQFDEPETGADGDDRRRADLYAFAVVLYELLTGRYPIAGTTPSSLIAGHLFRPPLDFSESDPAGRVPEAVRRAVLKGLAKDPAERFPDAESFAATLDAGEPVDPASPEVRRILDLSRRQALPRLAPAPPRGSTQIRLDQRFVAEPTPLPEEEESAPTLVLQRRPPRPSPPPEAVAGVRPSGVRPSAARPPADEIELAAAEVEQLIEDGDFAAARQRLEGLGVVSPGQPRLLELTVRLEETEQIANRPRVRELLGKAQEQVVRDDYAAALAELRRASELAPQDEQVHALLAATERAARRHQEEIERERAIAEHADRIAELLRRGELEDAARALRQAGESLGGHRRFSELRERLEGVQAALARRQERLESAARAARGVDGASPVDAGPKVDSAELLRQARELHRRGQLEPAIAKARQALALAPQHKMIQVLLFELEQELEDRRRSEARETARRAAEQEIRQLVDGGDFEAAAGRLPEALDVAGPTLVLKNLQAQVAQELSRSGERRRRRLLSRRERADSLVAEARSRAQADEFAAAGELLRQALELVPDHPEALTLRTSVDACVRVREEELRQAEEVERTVVSVRSLLDEGRTSDALTTLSRATGRFGDHKELQRLHYEAAQAQLDEADAATRGPSPQPTGRTTVKLAPDPAGSPAAAGSPEDVPAIDAEIDRIRGLTAEGKAGEAFEALQQALADHGQLPVLLALREEIGVAMLERDAEEEASGSRMIAIPTEARPAEARPVQARPAEAVPIGETPTIPLPASPSGPGSDQPPADDPFTAPTEVWPAAGPAAPPPAAGPPEQLPPGGAGAASPLQATARSAPARFDEIALDGMLENAPGGLPPPPPAPEKKSQRQAPPGGHGSRTMLIAGLLVVTVSLFLGVLLSHLSPWRDDEPEVEVQDVAALALDPGYAVLDAVPWAEITQVVPVSAEPPGESPGADSRITEAIPITPSRYTPVALELPPGRYRIVLRYPPAGADEEIEVEVASGGRIERRLSFEELDGQRYFEKVGW